MRVLLVSTYDLGRPPTDLLDAGRRLAASGHDVRLVDLAVEAWPDGGSGSGTDGAADGVLAWAQRVAFSVPMHTALRLAGPAAAQVRAARPDVPVAFFGLYAALCAGDGARFGPEALDDLVAWAGPPGEGTGTLGPLPPLERYARLSIGTQQRLAGAVSASRGCVHRCRHCPVPVAYDGRIRLVAVDDVVAAADAMVAAGARHLSFTDPDFLNAAGHARRVAAAVHARHPDVTFDCTVKVEHVLRHRDVWPELAAAGCVFVVSAFESADDETLAILDKGHTVADAAEAVHVLRRAGIEVRPTMLPFAPWTEPGDVADLFDFVAAHDLVGSVDAVQYAIRLLLPEGSLLLSHPAVAPQLGPYDADRLTYVWRSRDPVVDALAAELADVAEQAAAEGWTHEVAFDRMRSLADAAAGRDRVGAAAGSPGAGAGAGMARPRMTEPWFC